MADKLENQISGSVERITYYNDENGYTVLRLKPDRRDMLPYKYASGREALITVIGNMPALTPGEWLKIGGRWDTHAKHGRQFRAEKVEQGLPATTQGIKRYLGSGMVKGVGPVMAERIVDHFGAETLDIIEFEPQRLTEVQGIGKKRIAQVAKAWEEQKAIKDVMIFLQGHGVTTGLATKIYKKYEDEALTIVRNTPYRMVQEIRGIGFLTADKIAQAIGLAYDDPGRIEAGLAHTLNKMAEEGHVFVPESELIPAAAEILKLDPAPIEIILTRLESDQLVKRETLTGRSLPTSEDTDTRAVYLRTLYFAEVGTSNRIKALLSHKTSRLNHLRSRLPQINFTHLTLRSGVSLAPLQEQAVRAAVENKVAILTGGPGTGKTTTLRTLLDLLDEAGHTYALASPTGRAAKRLGEATGRSAKTIHRLLEFKPGEGFSRNDENPIDADMIVVDEASMLDIQLANSLLKAIGADSHLLLVGDVDQLPSVGPGDVLRDLIASEAVTLVRLQTIFRQASDSLIIGNAHRINEGQFPQTRKDATDFFIFVKQEPQEAAELLVDIVHKRLPHKFGLEPFDDIQVLSPMYNGAIGVANLNHLLQEALNPAGARKAQHKSGGGYLRVGDKVMQTVNNYDKSVYNGDIGRITAIDRVEQTVTVNIDGNPIVYDFLELDELVHAYAVTVHKSQGSEYPCVVVPVTTQHYMMLQRNLLYTAITRAKRLVVLVGTRRAIQIAVGNAKVNERHTALDWRLSTPA